MATAEPTSTKTKSPTTRSASREPDPRRLERLVWLPFGFAAFLSLITIVPIFFGLPDAGRPAFVAFFPMTIFFVCTILLSQSRRIARLEEELRRREARDESTAA